MQTSASISEEKNFIVSDSWKKEEVRVFENGEVCNKRHYLVFEKGEVGKNLGHSQDASRGKDVIIPEDCTANQVILVKVEVRVKVQASNF